VNQFVNHGDEALHKKAVEYPPLWKLWHSTEKHKIEIDPSNIGVEQFKKLLYCINLISVRSLENLVLVQAGF
jgi:hypothetical protein